MRRFATLILISLYLFVPCVAEEPTVTDSVQSNPATEDNITCLTPPFGLQWGMTHKEVREHLKSMPKSERIKIGKYVDGTRFKGGYHKAPLKKVKYFNMQAEEQYALFTLGDTLCAIIINFEWMNEEDAKDYTDTPEQGRHDCWTFYRNLFDTISAEYGKPVHAINDKIIDSKIPPNKYFNTKWKDNNNNEINIDLARATVRAYGSAKDLYYIVVSYSYKRSQANLKELGTRMIGNRR